MDVEILKCDILQVLQNDDHTILQKWISSCRDFRSRVAAEIEERLLLEADDTKKRSVNAEKISELQQEINTVKSAVDSVVLEEKKVDKQISNAIKSQENLKTESGEMMAQYSALEIEIMDLQIEIDQRKKKKVLQWDAVKRACKIYKMNLDIHINLQEEEDRQYIKFSFFTYLNKDKEDIYFVKLSCKQDDDWRIEEIEPKIKKVYQSQLSSIIDFPEYSKVSDITLFLCQVRNIYLKYFIKKREKNLKTI
ncbi:PREDICTED: uncharacterized protein LOC106749236 [Dinoponera quadriceps]|uniref:Uncharacterized protein LOC106749236 n=1 Tax=Dinoponera quadriceps TaxID=609295 RepID=A0A6P3Y179_DINQU|nr:PREDICTED: uncharacterized protein LOC106749236 [Dinoponera quadriceps]